jgi:hypothetical protein
MEMLRPFLLSALLTASVAAQPPGSSIPAATAPAPGGTAYVADKSCPFTRGEQPATSRLLAGVGNALQAMADKCQPLRPQVQSLSTALGILTQASGVNLQQPGVATKGYLGLSLTCSNYTDLLRAEYQSAVETWQSGVRDFPTAAYAACFKAAANAVERCLESVLGRKMVEKRHECLIQQDLADRDAARKAVQDGIQRVNTSASNLINGIDSCGAAGPEILDAALQTMGSIASLSPALGPYGAAASLGTNALRLLASKAEQLLKGTSASDAAARLKRAQTLDQLACLYHDTLSAAMACPQRLAEDDRRRKQAQVQATPPQSSRVFQALSLVSEQVARIRNGNAAQIGELLDGLENLLDHTQIQPPPFVYAAGMPAFSADPQTVHQYLRSAATYLKTYEYPTEDGRSHRNYVYQVRVQGAQLAGFLDAYEKYLKAPQESFIPARDALVQSLQTSRQATRDGIPFDFMEIIGHAWEKLPPEYGLNRLQFDQLSGASGPAPSSELPAAQPDLMLAFTSLVTQLQKETPSFFNDRQFAARNPFTQNLSPAVRAQEFATYVEPMLRACALLSGLFFYQADPERLQAQVRGDPSAWRRIFFWNPTDRERYRKSCEAFQCPGNRGLPRFQASDPSDTDGFHFSQCWMQKNYDLFRNSFRENYVTSGFLCGGPDGAAGGTGDDSQGRHHR